LTVETLDKLIDDIQAGRPIKPGPQIERHHSAPVGGFRALTTPELYDGSMVGQGAGLAAAREAIAAREAAAAEAARAAANPAPAEPPAAPAVKAQGEADKDKVPTQVKQTVPASDPAVRPDAAKKE
ncbi:MAG: NADH-quinone oxidoreductase subunit NuoE, partial [Rhizobiales bacterium]|nr:NADH-quinone oxidoreductase subunit NuoE [Hyphomicrobiales bacterium]